MLPSLSVAWQVTTAEEIYLFRLFCVGLHEAFSFT